MFIEVSRSDGSYQTMEALAAFHHPSAKAQMCSTWNILDHWLSSNIWTVSRIFPTLILVMRYEAIGEPAKCLYYINNIPLITNFVPWQAAHRTSHLVIALNNLF